MIALDRRRWSALLAGAAALSALSCFESPISERLEIRLLPGNMAVVSVVVRLANPEAFRESPPARERIERLRRDLQEGNDDWSRRFRSTKHGQERIVWDLDGGELAQLTRRAAFGKAEALRSFFSDSLIQARFTSGPEEAELALLPGHGSRATLWNRPRHPRRMGRARPCQRQGDEPGQARHRARGPRARGASEAGGARHHPRG